MPAGCEVFRPYVLRPLTLVAAVAVLAAFIALSYGLGTIGWDAWKPVDHIWLIALGILFAAILWRLGSVRAIATPASLTVRNIVRTRTFTWPEIIGVSYSTTSGQPWPLLDLADGTTYAVMAIQTADGARGFAAADRLRRLVDTYGTPDGPDN